MVYLLLIILLALCIISFFINKKDIVAPAFIFSIGFVIQAIFVVIYAKKWEMGLHLNTFFVITLGIAEFVIISYIVNLVFNFIRKNKNKIEEKEQNKFLENIENKVEYLKINMTLEILYLIFMLIISGVYLYFVVKSVNGSFENILTIFEAMSKYDNLLKFSDETIALPFLIKNLHELVIASGYWFVYVAINNFLSNKKINIVEILIIIVSIVSSMLNGSRTIAFMIMFAAIIMFIILLQKKKNKKNVITVKLVRNIVILGCIFVVIFYFSAQAWGRVSKEDKMYYFAIYCGAQVKNLDIYFQEKDYVKNNEIWGSQTFFSLVQTLGQKIGFKDFKNYRLDLPFREVNGLNLGNVYTTFYPYIYDFGYIGEFILVLIMAVISQVVYEFVKNTKLNKNPKLSILIYSNIVNCLILSFFSNKFYENIIAMAMIKKIVFWAILNLIFCKINYEKIFKEKIIQKLINVERKEK